MSKINPLDTLSRHEARKLAKLATAEIAKNMVVHHKDGNPLNNDLDNLCVITRRQHYQLHTKFGSVRRGKQPKGKRVKMVDRLEKWLTVYNDF